MVPPLCIDVNGDGVDEILISVFDGTFILLDGDTLDELWRKQFPGIETYRYYC